MPLLLRIALGLAWLLALAWLVRVVVSRLMLRQVPDLVRDGEGAPALALPSLTVIVPARNEAADIAATLRSLLAIQGVALQIIAVNDRSDDQTGAIMDALAAEQPAGALEVLHVAELPPGWLGKTHAMHLGAQRATGEWLLFTDADVLFHPQALRLALGYAVRSGADHMVLLPTLVLRSVGERMMVSFLQVLSVWALRPWAVADPGTRDSIGVGAFNLIRREVYDALGGWASLRLEVLEDVALGRRVKAAGFRQRVALGLDLVSVRWARGAFGVVENLTKNLFAFFHFSPGRLLAFWCALALFTLFPLAGCFAGRTFWWPAGVWLLALFLGYQGAGKYHHFSPLQVLGFPLASSLLMYALFRSMLLALWRGGITWRGTFYPLRDLRNRRSNGGD